MDDHELSGLSPEDAARVSELLTGREGDEERFVAKVQVGPFRQSVRLVLQLMSLAVVGVTGWHLFALAYLPDTSFDGVHAPVALTIGFALLGILLLLWFDGRWRWLPLLLLGIGALAVSGLSMRWVASSRSGIHEYWAGLERGRAVLPENLCYRIDGTSFALGRPGARAGFTYARGVWPTAFNEAEFKRYFFSDLPMQARADGWVCVAR